MHAFFRKLIPFLVALTYFVVQPASADPAFYEPFQSNAPTPDDTSPPPSPEDFKNLVKSLGEKNRDELSQQFQKEVSEQPKESTTTQPTTQTPQTAMPNTENPPSETPMTETQPAPVSSSPAAPGASPPIPAFDRSASPPTTTTPSTPGQVYTGFGSGTGAGAPPPPASQQTPGGWNIKY